MGVYVKCELNNGLTAKQISHWRSIIMKKILGEMGVLFADASDGLTGLR